MKTRIFLSAMLMAATQLLSAQGAADAMNYSLGKYTGTARSISMGGAFGALGGDFSAIAINPAGLGVYRSSELTITPSLNFAKAESEYLGGLAMDDAISLSMNQFGLVINMFKNESANFSGLNLAFGFTNLRNFDSNFKAGSRPEGLSNSFIDFMSYNANTQGVAGDFNPGSIGYNSYLLNESGNGYQPVLFGSTNTQQTRSIQEKGYLNEWNLAISGNIDSKYYFGGSINIQDMYYRRKLIHNEVFLNSSPTYQIYNPHSKLFEDGSEGGFTYYDNLKAVGTGMNVSFGAIARVMDNLRFGYSIKTPTLMSVSETYTADMYSSVQAYLYNDLKQDYNTFKSVVGEKLSPEGNFDYVVITPGKQTFSMAFVAGQKGLISADIENVWYRSMELRDNEYSSAFFQDANLDIKSFYRNTYNVRLGGEYRPETNFAIRAGVNLVQSPMSSASDSYAVDRWFDETTYSFGAGYRSTIFFIDAAYSQTAFNKSNLIYAYPAGNSGMVMNESLGKNKINSFIVTLGLRF